MISKQAPLNLSIMWTAIWILGIACTPDDDDRCGDDYIFDNNACVPIQDSAMPPGDSESAEDSEDSDSHTPASDTTTESDGASTGPTGLGSVCQGQKSDCDGMEASYCVKNPANETGYCSVQECSQSPDNCPSGYHCCKFVITPSDPTFCVTAADWTTMASMCQ